LFLVVAVLSARGWAQQDVISKIDVSGNRRIPADTIRARIFTKPGDIYDAAALERDFNSNVSRRPKVGSFTSTSKNGPPFAKSITWA